MKKSVFLGVVGAAGLVAASAGASTLEDIKARGELNCGVNTGLVGFAAPDANNNWQGFDIELCRAVAAATLGNPDAVTYVPLTGKTRFTALAAGEIDMLSRNTTWTFSRDVDLKFEFVGINYYDGQGFMVPRELGVTSALDLDGATVCIQTGTTTELNLADFFRSNNISYEPVPIETNAEAQQQYLAGACDVYTTDASGLAATRAAFENPGDHVVLPEIVSKEPLGPLVRHGDSPRRESIQPTTNRHPGLRAARIGAEAQGRLVGMVFDGVFDTGAYASWGPTVANRVPVHASGPYRIGAYRAEARAVHTTNPVAGAFRGFGVPQAALLQETLFDRLAEACGMDRLDFRRLNALSDGDSTATGQRLFGVGIGACLDALKPHWQRAQADAAAANCAGGALRHGVGLACCWYGCGNTSLPNPSTIRLGFGANGVLTLHQGATDIGQGANTVITQICADALGLPVTAFSLIGPDTALTPDCGKTSASRQTFVTGRAAAEAGTALRAEILRRANAGEDGQLDLTAGRLTVRDAQGTRPVALDGPLDLRGYAISAEATYDPPTTPLDENGQGVPYAVYGYGAQMAELAVDTGLGTVKVSRITAAHDLGRVINPQLAEGQIEGGIAQGLGLALMEEYVPGRTENLHDYLIPTFGDMPAIQSILIEVPDPEGPFGAKGLGEHVLIPTAPAILNAIRHATGAEIDRVPALPHRLMAALDAVPGRAARDGQH
ncbi:MAG: molybdopterin cofactor-binding domain-containing protein [Pseudomonadota bacterium]